MQSMLRSLIALYLVWLQVEALRLTLPSSSQKLILPALSAAVSPILSSVLHNLFIFCFFRKEVELHLLDKWKIPPTGVRNSS